MKAEGSDIECTLTAVCKPGTRSELEWVENGTDGINRRWM